MRKPAAVWNAQASERKPLALRWAAFGILAVLACCLTPYGWNSLIAAYRILTLGEALPMITEWRPMDFSRLGPFEIVVLAAIGFALWRGVTLPPLRLAMLLGLLHMALSSVRHADALAMLAPLLVASPLAQQVGKPERATTASMGSIILQFAAAASLAAVIGAMLVTLGYAPPASASPAAAVAALKRQGAQRILNDYGFGGYMIASGLAPFIDGRTELYGPKMMLQHDLALSSGDPSELSALLDGHNIDATLLSPTTPAAKLLDHTEGWRRLFADDVAVVHIRQPAALPQE